jgi:hypothetical protein
MQQDAVLTVLDGAPATMAEYACASDFCFSSHGSSAAVAERVKLHTTHQSNICLTRQLYKQHITEVTAHFDMPCNLAPIAASKHKCFVHGTVPSTSSS